MSNKLRAYAITDNNITVNLINGQTHIIPRTDALADKLIQALREGRNDDISELISVAKRVEKYGNGNFKVIDNIININGFPIPEVLSRKIIKFQSEDLPYHPLVKFAENLQKNPSYRSVNELFQFLEKNDHPITENGNFMIFCQENHYPCAGGNSLLIKRFVLILKMFIMVNLITLQV